jgi:hypothetical protein
MEEAVAAMDGPMPGINPVNIPRPDPMNRPIPELFRGAPEFFFFTGFAARLA